jgi:hypothetical protein
MPAMGVHSNPSKFAVKDSSSYDLIASLPEIQAMLPRFARSLQQSSLTKSGFKYAQTNESERFNGLEGR